MEKLKIKFETIRFPLIILFVTVTLKGLSHTLLSEPFYTMLVVNFKWLITLMEITRDFSGLLIKYLPFIIVIKVLGKKHSSERVVLMFIVSYLLFLTVTKIVGQSTLPPIVYENLFGMSTTVSSGQLVKNSINLVPFRLGFIGVIIVGYISDLSFRKTRSRTRYGFLPYIDKDVLGLITTIFLTTIAAVGFSYIWPTAINLLYKVFEWIARDITNPVSTFVYGFLDRILSLLNISDINRESFWFTSLGGSWMNDLGENFVGDISIWNQQIKNGIFNSGFGRFITPYYIVNLFAIPGFVLGVYSLYTNKRERLNVLSFSLLIIIVSMFADLSLPLEIFLVIMAPMLYAFHLFTVSSLFAILQGFKIFIGSVYSGPVSNMSLGNGLELFSFFQYQNLQTSIISVLAIGLGVGLIYFFITRFYYKHLSLGLINKFEIEVLVDEILEVVGGIDNIDKVDSSPFRIEVELVRPQLFNYERLETTNISRVIETKSSYALYYGTASTIIRKEIMLRKEMMLP